jgi:hypothetical protein
MISLLQSVAGHRPLQFLAISLDPRLLAPNSCQPCCPNRHSTWPEDVLHYVYQDAVSTVDIVVTLAKPAIFGFGLMVTSFPPQFCMGTMLIPKFFSNILMHVIHTNLPLAPFYLWTKSDGPYRDRQWEATLFYTMLSFLLKSW